MAKKPTGIETPNTKLQTSKKLQKPEKLQVPSPKRGSRFKAWSFSGVWSLGVGVWALELLWDLELGVWSFN
jgi:hypothetical protein